MMRTPSDNNSDIFEEFQQNNGSTYFWRGKGWVGGGGGDIDRMLISISHVIKKRSNNRVLYCTVERKCMRS